MASTSTILTRRATLSGLAALAGCAARFDPGLRTQLIHLAARDWHTEIVLPVATRSHPLAALAERFPGTSHLSIGFGDRAYLLAPQVDFLDMLAALFPGPGALLVTGLHEPPALAFGPDNVVAMLVSAEGQARLEDFIWRSVTADARGAAAVIGEGPYRNSRLYESTVTYDATTTCNTWTAQALRAAELPIIATGVLFADQVMAQARRMAAHD